ncbi:uncharacterized protein LOC108652689 [Drosophila navojoa]|uniref:uncharacterized protein LOC108652689 n=1 Tax=Drosophila navojoa TaxID=7232 RepID=UPI0008475120|nr:uncharacterized protein LOC108652689 [Drosophila navojoa]
MTPKWKTSIILLYLLLIENVYMKATVKFTNVKCGSLDPSLSAIDQCRLRAISRNKTLLNIAVNLLKTAKKLDLHWQTKVWGNGYKPWLGEYNIDFCAYLRKPNHPVVKILYDAIKPFTNINHSCPLSGMLIVKDMFWDISNYKLPMPSGDYLVVLTWKQNNIPSIYTNVYFTFKQDLIYD